MIFGLGTRVSHNKKKVEHNGGDPRQSCRRGMRVVLKKSIIDTCNIIGSDCSRAGVDEETTLVCHQRR